MSKLSSKQKKALHNRIVKAMADAMDDMMKAQTTSYKKIPRLKNYTISINGTVYNTRTKKFSLVLDFKHRSGRYRIKGKLYTVEELVNRAYGPDTYAEIED